MINIFQKFKEGLKRTTSNISYGIKEIVINKEISDKLLEQIEEFLIQSDVGTKAASEIIRDISSRKIDPSKNELEEIKSIINKYVLDLMKPLENKGFFKKLLKKKQYLFLG